MVEVIREKGDFIKASLVIPTYNKLERLKFVIESLKNQTENSDNYEVIIVDDGSSDGTSEYVNNIQVPFKCRYIAQTNKGRSAARNIGIQNANYEIVIFSDDDMILDPEFIHNRLQYYKNKKYVVHGKIMELSRLKFFKDPSKGIFYNDIRLSESTKRTMLKSCIFLEIMHDKDLFQKKIVETAKVPAIEGLIKRLLLDYPSAMDWVSFVGGNISAPKSVLVDVGGFDETFGSNWGCEDVELGYRLMQKGIKFVYAEDSVNYHIAHYHKNANKEHSVNFQLFYSKYKEPKIQLFGDFASGKITAQDVINRL